MFNVRMNKFGNKVSGNFSMTFANGYSVSVAMGDGTYSKVIQKTVLPRSKSLPGMLMATGFNWVIMTMLSAGRHQIKF